MRLSEKTLIHSSEEIVWHPLLHVLGRHAVDAAVRTDCCIIGFTVQMLYHCDLAMVEEMEAAVVIGVGQSR